MLAQVGGSEKERNFLSFSLPLAQGWRLQLLVLDPSRAAEIFSVYRNGEFSLSRKLYATEIKVDYSTRMAGDVLRLLLCW